MTKQDLVNQHARWAITLLQYTFTIEHRPGANHQNADTLSRFPHISEEDVTEARLGSVAALTTQLQEQKLHAISQRMQALSFLTAIAPSSDAFMPGDEEFIKVDSDRPMSIKELPAMLTSLRKAHMPTCGGYDQHTVTSALTVTSRPVCLPWILIFTDDTTGRDQGIVLVQRAQRCVAGCAGYRIHLDASNCNWHT